MLRLAKILLVLAMVSVVTTSTFAGVVIGNITTGTDELSSAVAASQSDSERATGDLDEFRSGELSDQWNLPSSRSGGKKNAYSAVSNLSGNRLQYPKSNRANRGGGGGGGSLGGPRVAPGRRDGGRGVIQSVTVNGNKGRGPNSQGETPGVDISLYDSGKNTPATGGKRNGVPGSPGNSGRPSAGFSGGGPPKTDGTLVSGTPEPAAIAIWTFAIGCGLGVLRFQNRRKSAA